MSDREAVILLIRIVALDVVGERLDHVVVQEVTFLILLSACSCKSPRCAECMPWNWLRFIRNCRSSEALITACREGEEESQEVWKTRSESRKKKVPLEHGMNGRSNKNIRVVRDDSE